MALTAVPPPLRNTTCPPSHPSTRPPARLPAHPPACPLQLASTTGHDEASNKAMYALARLVAGPAPSARAAFFNLGGLTQLQALLGGASKAPTRVKTRAVNLVSDLIGGPGRQGGRGGKVLWRARQLKQGWSSSLSSSQFRRAVARGSVPVLAQLVQPPLQCIGVINTNDFAPAPRTHFCGPLQR